MTPYIPNCSVPLLFEGTFEEAPYGLAGTGFLMRYGNAPFFATASHCLGPGDHNRLRVPESYRSDRILRLEQFASTIFPPGEQDSDYADFVLFSVAPVEFGGREERNLEPAYVLQSDIAAVLNERVILTVRGYPMSAPLLGIDYDQQVVTVQALTCDAAYLGRATSQHCHRLQFISTCPVSDFNHMSGSPVFAKLLICGELIYVLVGLLLRAGGPQRLGQFVSIGVIREALRKFGATTPQLSP